MLEHLIVDTYGQAATAHYADYKMTSEARQAAAEVGTTILRQHPPIAGACALMGALYVTGLRRVLSDPIHLVAGRLEVDGVRVFGRTGLVSAPMPFLQSNLDWDGHMWVMIGNHIADISLFRTGRSSGGHPALKRMMAREFGDNAPGLLVFATADAALSGIKYFPDYILTQDEIEGLERGANLFLGASAMACRGESSTDT